MTTSLNKITKSILKLSNIFYTLSTQLPNKLAVDRSGPQKLEIGLEGLKGLQKGLDAETIKKFNHEEITNKFEDFKGIIDSYLYLLKNNINPKDPNVNFQYVCIGILAALSNICFSIRISKKGIQEYISYLDKLQNLVNSGSLRNFRAGQNTIQDLIDCIKDIFPGTETKNILEKKENNIKVLNEINFPTEKDEDLKIKSDNIIDLSKKNREKLLNLIDESVGDLDEEELLASFEYLKSMQKIDSLESDLAILAQADFLNKTEEGRGKLNATLGSFKKSEFEKITTEINKINAKKSDKEKILTDLNKDRSSKTDPQEIGKIDRKISSIRKIIHHLDLAKEALEIKQQIIRGLTESEESPQEQFVVNLAGKLQNQLNNAVKNEYYTSDVWAEKHQLKNENFEYLKTIGIDEIQINKIKECNDFYYQCITRPHDFPGEAKSEFKIFFIYLSKLISSKSDKDKILETLDQCGKLMIMAKEEASKKKETKAEKRKIEEDAQRKFNALINDFLLKGNIKEFAKGIDQFELDPIDQISPKIIELKEKIIDIKKYLREGRVEELQKEYTKDPFTKLKDLFAKLKNSINVKKSKNINYSIGEIKKLSINNPQELEKIFFEILNNKSALTGAELEAIEILKIEIFLSMYRYTHTQEGAGKKKIKKKKITEEANAKKYIEEFLKSNKITSIEIPTTFIIKKDSNLEKALNALTPHIEYISARSPDFRRRIVLANSIKKIQEEIINPISHLLNLNIQQLINNNTFFEKMERLKKINEEFKKLTNEKDNLASQAEIDQIYQIFKDFFKEERGEEKNNYEEMIEEESPPLSKAISPQPPQEEDERLKFRQQIKARRNNINLLRATGQLINQINEGDFEENKNQLRQELLIHQKGPFFDFFKSACNKAKTMYVPILFEEIFEEFKNTFKTDIFPGEDISKLDALANGEKS